MEREPVIMNPNDLELKVTTAQETDNILANYYKHGLLVNFNRPVNVEKDEWQLLVIEYKWNGHENIPWHLDVGMCGDDQALLQWSEDSEERFIYPRLDHQEQELAIYQMYNVGDIITWDCAAPGIGHQTFRVDRKDDKGLWGICIEDTCWVPDGDFYR